MQPIPSCKAFICIWLLLILCAQYFIIPVHSIDDVPPPPVAVELWVQSQTSISIGFETPDMSIHQPPVDQYLVEWSLSPSFADSQQGLVIVTHIPQISYQYDVVGLPHGMKEKVYTRVRAHNRVGWGQPMNSNPASVAIADFDKAPDETNRRASAWSEAWLNFSKVFHYFLWICIIGVIFVALYFMCIHCCERTSASSAPSSICSKLFSWLFFSSSSSSSYSNISRRVPTTITSSSPPSNNSQVSFQSDYVPVSTSAPEDIDLETEEQWNKYSTKKTNRW